jgi:hypothetical protein
VRIDDRKAGPAAADTAKLGGEDYESDQRMLEEAIRGELAAVEEGACQRGLRAAVRAARHRAATYQIN